MEHLDEVILELRQELSKKQHTDVYTGMYVDNTLINFKRFFFFEDQMSVMLPDDFAEMDLSVAKLKYPAENRPELILTSEDTTINFTFKYIDLPMKESQLAASGRQLKMAMQRLNPSNLFYESDAVNRQDGTSIWFDYKSYALDDTMYNFIYVTDINGKLMQGAFNCSFSIYKQWKDVAIQVVKSIRDRTKEK